MSKLERAPLPPSSAGKISIIQNEHLSFFSRGATLFVSLTVVWCHSLPHPPLVKALYITSYLAALFPGFMQCADISIFLGLSAPRMILIRLTYKKDSLSAEKTVIWAHLCVTGVILALSVNVLYTSTLFHLRIRLNKTVSCLYFLFFFWGTEHAKCDCSTLFSNRDVRFSVDNWNFPFSYRDFPCAHTA